MSKKYLIRRENCRFIGPLDIHEFRQAIRKMQFGLADEVAGHCGPWVVLDDEAALKKRYPELAAIVSEEIPAAWREMTGHANQLSQKEKKVKQKKERKSSSYPAMRSKSRSRPQQKSKSNIFAALSVLIAGAALGGAFWIKSQEDPLPPISEVAGLAQQSDPTQFLNEMGLRIVPIVTKISKSRDKDTPWLPYLRMYAFHTSGVIENLSMKTLRGNAPAAAPLDCSVEAWKKRWNEGGQLTASFVSGKSLPKTAWAKALVWDPSWIRRRNSKGWIKPRNWVEGCLMSASVAMRALSSDNPAMTQAGSSAILAGGGGLTLPEVVSAVVRRLQIQLELIQIGKANISPDGSTILGKLSCFDIAASSAELDACRDKNSEPALQQMIDEYANNQAVRIAMQQTSGTLDGVLQAAVNAVVAKGPADQSLSFDNAAELQFAKDIQQSGFKVDGAAERVVAQFPDVRLRFP